MFRALLYLAALRHPPPPPFVGAENWRDALLMLFVGRMFKRHVKKLKDSYLSEKVARYLDLLPEVLFIGTVSQD